MNAAVSSVISIAGSARNRSAPRRAPEPPNALPMSIAARNMRARANTPTSAMMSAAGAKGPRRGHRNDARGDHWPNRMYGVQRIGRASCANTASLLKNSRACRTRRMEGAGGFLQPGSALVYPALRSAASTTNTTQIWKAILEHCSSHEHQRDQRMARAVGTSGPAAAARIFRKRIPARGRWR